MVRWGIVVIGLIAAATAYVLATPNREPEVRAHLSLATALRRDGVEGFRQALAPRAFVFPRDHGPHPAFRTEWWYFTGNLETPTGRRLGYQLTFFRSALTPTAPRRASTWATNQVYMAHFALTDAAGERFHTAERFSRGAVGLSGARAEPFRVWLDDWTAESTADGSGRLRLVARDGAVSIDLTLQREKPVVLHGLRGLSQKSAERGNASYYYSLTRLATQGIVSVASEPVTVHGSSWMDREWSTSALGADQVGWDWFALQLDDGRDLMVYRLRRADGSADAWSSGTMVAADGSTERLAGDDVSIDVLGTWQSPRGGARYPARWRVRVPRAKLDLDVRPILADQELDLSFRYWEGAVDVAGTGGDRPITGRGYVELTGYGEPLTASPARAGVR